MRIFISSPGDVKTERRIAHRILKKLAAQYESFEPFEIFLSELHPSQGVPIPVQDQLPRADEFDLFVCILWSRMGTPLPESMEAAGEQILIVGPNGETKLTGTEYEFAWALEGWKKKKHPLLMVYRKKAPSADQPLSAAEAQQLAEELRRVEVFEQQFKTEDGTYISARHSFLNDIEFEELFEIHARTLIKERLKEKGHDDDAIDLARPPAVWSDRCPFRGLGRFEYEHAPVFFGRDRVTQEVISRLEKRYDNGCGFLALVGGSGAGKSSLVRAGVIPSLVKRASDGTDAPVLDCRVAIASLDEQGGPALVVARSLLHSAVKDSIDENSVDEKMRPPTLPVPRTGVMSDAVPFAAKIVEDPGFAAREVGIQLSSLCDVLRADKRNPSSAESRLLLFVDQFEQLFNDQISQQERNQVIHFLKSLATNGLVRIVVALRSDYYGKFQEHETLMQLRGEDGQFDVSPPGPSDIERILRDAATAADLTFESESADHDLADMLVQETQSQPNSLPLLSMCLERLYQEDCLGAGELLQDEIHGRRDLAKALNLDGVHQRQASEMTLKTYNRLGGVKGAVCSVAAVLEKELSEQEFAAHKSVFWKLVHLSDASDRPRSQVTSLATFQDEDARESFVRRCAAHRLLTVYEKSDGTKTQTVVGLTHESLFESWPLLKSWLDEYRQLLPIRARIEQNQIRWEQSSDGQTSDKDSSLLLPPGLPLEESHKLLKESPSLLSGSDTAIADYIHASITHNEMQTRQRRRRRQVVMLALSTLTILALTGGTFAWIQQQEAEKQTGIAKTNAAEAEIQREAAEFARSKAEKNAAAAKREKSIAETNAKVAREQSDLALSTLNSVIFDVQRSLENVPGGATVRNRLLSSVLPQLDKVSTQFAAKSAVDRNTMATLSELAQTILQLGQSSPQALREHSQVGEDAPNTAASDPTTKSAVLIAERLLRRSLEIAQQLADADPSDARKQHDLSTAYNNLGHVFLTLGRTDDALEQFEDGFKITRALAEADPSDAQNQRGLSVSYNNLGKVFLKLGRTEDALSKFQDFFNISRTLVEADPSDAQKQRDLLVSYHNLGSVFLTLGRTDDALTQFENSLKISYTLAEADPSDVQKQRDLAGSYERLGTVSLTLGNTEDAWKYFANELEIAERRMKADPADVDAKRFTSDVYKNLGDVFLELGRTEDALKQFEESLKIRRTLAEADPSDARKQRDLAISYERLGMVSLTLGNAQDALKFFTDELEVAERRMKADPADVGAKQMISLLYKNLGDVFLTLGRTDDALSQFEDSLKIRRTLAEADPSDAKKQRDLSDSYERLGDVFLMLGRTDDALIQLEDTLKIRRTLADADPSDAKKQSDLSVSYNNLGYLFLELGRTDDALRRFEDSFKICRTLADADPSNALKQRALSESYNNLGNVYLALGRTDDALRQFEDSFKISRTLVDADPSNALNQSSLSVSYNNLGDVFLKLRRTEDAMRQFEDSLKIHRMLADADPSDAYNQSKLSDSYNRLGNVFLNLDRTDEALMHYEDSFKISRTLADADPSNAQKQRSLAVSYNNLGDVYLALGRTDDALRQYEDSLKIRRTLADADPSNAQKQRALWLSHNRLGDVFLKLDRTDDALSQFEDSLKIAHTLAQADSRDAEKQSDLSVSYNRMGDVFLELGRTDDAMRQFEDSLKIAHTLAQADPSNAQKQRSLRLSHNRLGDVFLKLDRTDDALTQFEGSLKIAHTLAQAYPSDAQLQRDLVVSYYKLGDRKVQLSEYEAARDRFQQCVTVLDSMIARKLNVESAEKEKAVLERLVEFCQAALLATDDWETLLKTDENQLPGLLVTRTALLFQSGHTDDVAQVGAKLRELAATADSAPNPDRPAGTKHEMLYNAACAYSLCATLVVKDKPEPSESELTEQKKFIALALACLKEAIAAGYDNFDHMQQDSDLTSLHDVPEFKALIPQPDGEKSEKE